MILCISGIIFLFETDSQPLIGLSIAPESVLLDDVQCVGTEVSLLDCTARVIGDHNCNASDGAGVRCQGKFVP